MHTSFTRDPHNNSADWPKTNLQNFVERDDPAYDSELILELCCRFNEMVIKSPRWFAFQTCYKG